MRSLRWFFLALLLGSSGAQAGLHGGANSGVAGSVSPGADLSAGVATATGGSTHTLATWTSYINGGPWNAGSILFSNGTTITEDNTNLYFDDTNNRLYSASSHTGIGAYNYIPPSGTGTGFYCKVNTPLSGVSPCIRLDTTTEYDRAWILWRNPSNVSEVAMGYHYRNFEDEAIHDQFEIKTIAEDGADLRTRFTLHSNQDYANASFVQIRKLQVDSTVTNPSATNVGIDATHNVSASADNAFSVSGLSEVLTLTPAPTFSFNGFTASGNFSVVNAAAGILANAIGVLGNVGNSSTGVITQAKVLQANQPTNTGGGSITGAAGVVIQDHTVATNNTNLLIGTTTVPTGNYSIRNTSTSQNVIRGNTRIGGGSTTDPVGVLDIGGPSSAISTASWTTNGIRIRGGAGTFTCTDCNGTVTTVGVDAYAAATLAASSSTTYTNAYGAIFNVPTAGTNVTITSARPALFQGGQVRMTGGLSADGGTISLNNNSNNTTNLCSGTTTSACTIGGANTLTVTGASTVLSGAGGTITVPNISSDATHTDSSVCQDTTTHALYAGSGTLGICLGTSSARYKERVKSMDDGLKEILALKPVTFFYKKGRGDDGAKENLGFLAEDVQKVLPKLVGLDVDKKPNSVDLLGMVPVLVRAVQELQAEVDALKVRNAWLEGSQPTPLYFTYTNDAATTVH